MAIKARFTLDGKWLPEWGTIEVAPKWDDVHLVFTRGRATIRFTKDGKEIGKRQRCPANADDVHWTFDPETGAITTAFWTNRGRRMMEPVIEIPEGANDVHLTVTGDITVYWFTINGEFPPSGKPLIPPKQKQKNGTSRYPNDFHFGILE